MTPTAPMGGGTQLLEGAHLTGANTRFCRDSSKCRDFSFFGASNVPHETFQMCPLKFKDMTQMCPLEIANLNQMRPLKF